MSEKKTEGRVITELETNMRIWEQVCTTDPANTKHIDQRGGFTAIDAYSQIQRATEVFGPVGEGWGWTIIPIHQNWHGDLCVVAVEVWHSGAVNEHGQHHVSFPVFGAVPWIPFGNKVDADAPKKALTDAITKGLSYLGFNADVFLGKFDSNKYTGSQNGKESTQSGKAPEAHPAPEPPTHEDGAPFTGSGTITELEQKTTKNDTAYVVFKLKTEDALVWITCWSDHTREAAIEYGNDAAVHVTGEWHKWEAQNNKVYWDIRADIVKDTIPF